MTECANELSKHQDWAAKDLNNKAIRIMKYASLYNAISFTTRNTTISDWKFDNTTGNGNGTWYLEH
jgi:hypothetical protein